MGAAIKNDLVSLQYEVENVLDLQTIYKDAIGGFALALCAKKLLNNRTGFQEGQHSAIDDARMTLALYKHYQKSSDDEIYSDCEKLSASRAEYKKTKPKYKAEKCTCNELQN